jgi:hypothetical protein
MLLRTKDPLLEKLSRGLELFVLVRDVAFVHSCFDNLPEADDPVLGRQIVRLRDGYESLVKVVVAEAQDAGVFRKGATVKGLELTILNLLNWTIFWYRMNGELSPENLAELFEIVYLDGVYGRA